MNKTLQYVFDKPKWTRLGETLRYALYVIVHPFDGFWDLTHEKRGSLAAANIITALLVVTEVLTLTGTDHQFIRIQMENFSVILVAMRVLVPMLLWTLSNWGLTTLMDGKGRLPEVYMATAYAFTPYIIINLVMILVSHIMTAQEVSIYAFFVNLAIIWSVLLVLAAMMMIHDYSAARAIGSSLLSVVGMAFMVFVFLIFFSLITDAVAYFISLYNELVYRLT
jgi:hypothetical protein